MQTLDSVPLPERKIELRKRDNDNLGQSIELSKIVAGIKNKTWIIALTSVLCMVAGIFAFLLGPKVYQAESLLFYELKVPPTLANHYAVNHLSYTTAVELAQLPANFRSVRTILGLDIEEDKIKEMVTIQTPQKGSSLIRINTTSHSPELALNVANTLAKVTTKRALEFNQIQLKDAYGYFVRELDIQRKSLDQATLELAQFRIDNKHTGTDTEDLPILEKIEQLEGKFSDVSREYNGIVVQYENAVRLLAEMPDQVARYDYETSPLKIRLNRAEMALLDARTRYSEENPKIKLLEKESAELKKMLEEESKQQNGYKVYENNPAKAKLNANVGAIQNKLKVVQRLREDLQDELDKKKQEIAKMPQLQADFSKLMYKRTMVQTHVHSIEEAIKTIETLMAAGTSDVNIYQLAERAEKNINFMFLALPFIGLFVGAGVSLCAIAVAEVLDRKIRTRSQVESRYNPPCLLVLPEIHHLDKKIQELGVDKSPLNNYIFRLADRIEYFTRNKNVSSIACTSASKAEGKSTIIQHLAHYYATCSMKVLLLKFVPASVAEPAGNLFSFAEFMNMSNEQLLQHEANNLTSLVITFNDETHKLLGTQEGAFALSHRNLFNLVLVDCPGLLDGEIAVKILQNVDQTLFVVGSNTATLDMVDAGMLHCELYGINPLGIVLTKAHTAYVDKTSI